MHRPAGLTVGSLMFPHVIDRYRLVGKLVRAARKSYPARKSNPGLPSDTQAAIVNRTNRISDGPRIFPKTLSFLDHLENSLKYRERWVPRDRLVAVLARGLELGRDEIDSIMWVYDGEPLQPNEIQVYRVGPRQNSLTRDNLRD